MKIARERFRCLVFLPGTSLCPCTLRIFQAGSFRRVIIHRLDSAGTHGRRTRVWHTSMTTDGLLNATRAILQITNPVRRLRGLSPHPPATDSTCHHLAPVTGAGNVYGKRDAEPRSMMISRPRLSFDHTLFKSWSPFRMLGHAVKTGSMYPRFH